MIAALKTTSPQSIGLTRTERRKAEFNIIDLLFGGAVSELKGDYYDRQRGTAGDFEHFITALGQLLQKDYENIGYRELFLTVSHWMDVYKGLDVLRKLTGDFLRYATAQKRPLGEMGGTWSLFLCAWYDASGGEDFLASKSEETISLLIDLIRWGIKRVDLDQTHDHNMQMHVQELMICIADAGRLDSLFEEVNASSCSVFFIQAALETATTKTIDMPPEIVSTVADTCDTLFKKQINGWWALSSSLLKASLDAFASFDRVQKSSAFNTLRDHVLRILSPLSDSETDEQYQARAQLYVSACRMLRSFVNVDSPSLLQEISLLSAPFPSQSSLDPKLAHVFFDFWQSTFAKLTEPVDCPISFRQILAGIKRTPPFTDLHVSFLPSFAYAPF
ncbi:hypothetical protein BT69DRAFT_93857 [Atractiella rhizophila]|nr:hypothetical protein BT69DRAFT_93857 [Atractiella rhizophila]